MQSALQPRQGIAHILARHVEAASHMAEGYTRAKAGNATMLASDFVLGIGNRWASRHTGSVETCTAGRKFVHVDIEPTQIGRVFTPDLGIVSDAKIALHLFLEVARERQAAGALKDRADWVHRCQKRKRLIYRNTHFE
jgi:tartronate-semialdehyde synthase